MDDIDFFLFNVWSATIVNAIDIQTVDKWNSTISAGCQLELRLNM